MKTRSNMPLFVLEVSDVKALSNSQIDLLRCGDWLVKKDASGEHPYQVTFKKEGVGMCLTYHDASVIETQSYDWNNSLKKWVYNSEDKTPNLLDTNKLEQIVDKDGHKRFIEGEITMNTISGFTQLYGKWSLSGTHLLIVLAISGTNTSEISSGAELCNFELPQWVYDKIAILFGSANVDRKSFTWWGDDNSQQSASAYLRKANNKFFINHAGLTLTADRQVRISYDLLIDNE